MREPELAFGVPLRCDTRVSASEITARPKSDSTGLYRYRDGLYAVDLLAAAIVHLDFFNWLSSEGGSATPQRVRERFEFAERPADVLFTLLVANGLLSRADDGSLTLTETAREHLLAGSPWDITPYYASMADRPVCVDFVKVLRTGRPANWGSFDDIDDWHAAMETDQFAKDFTAAMDCRGVLLGQALAEEIREELDVRSHVLDIGGGSGVYACALVAANEHLQATVLEKEPVDEIARSYIEKRGFGDRVRVEVADIFEDAFPENCDAHLFSNVLHDWDVSDVRKLLSRSSASLDPGGLLVVHEAFLNEEKTGPLPVAEYSALLMAVTQGKCYSTAEMRTFLEEAGFEWIRHRDTAIDRGCIIGRKL